MKIFLVWLRLVAALVLIGNFAILRIYGDTLQSTHLFIVRGTVFYPVAWLNLLVGVMLIATLILECLASRKKRKNPSNRQPG
jgi:preprotein translocase subunit SecG